MKLLYAATSPFVRKVSIVVAELGIADRIERVVSTASPLRQNPEVASHNPLGKLPTLIVEGGPTLYGSDILCDYLCSLVPGNGVLATVGDARWRALRDQGLADGLLEAALLIRYELMRPEGLRWSDWTDGQMTKITTALAAIEADAAALDGRVDVGSIAIACALGYLDFRFADLNWRADCPTTAGWFETFSQRPSFAATRPE